MTPRIPVIGDPRDPLADFDHERQFSSDRYREHVTKPAIERTIAEATTDDDEARDVRGTNELTSEGPSYGWMALGLMVLATSGWTAYGNHQLTKQMEQYQATPPQSIVIPAPVQKLPEFPDWSQFPDKDWLDTQRALHDAALVQQMKDAVRETMQSTIEANDLHRSPIFQKDPFKDQPRRH